MAKGKISMDDALLRHVIGKKSSLQKSLLSRLQEITRTETLKETHSSRGQSRSLKQSETLKSDVTSTMRTK